MEKENNLSIQEKAFRICVVSTAIGCSSFILMITIPFLIFVMFMFYASLKSVTEDKRNENKPVVGRMK